MRGEPFVKPTFYRPTWAEINLEHIAYNIKQMKQRLSSSTKIMAVVKANGYGHGAIEVAKTALKSGAEAVAVALLEEAVELRKANINVPILVLGRTEPIYAGVASEYDVTLSVFQADWFEVAEEYIEQKPLKVHLEVDTGMNRTGLKTLTELNACLQTLSHKPSIELTGVYTHFATADEQDPTYMNEQIEKFEDLLQVFSERSQSSLAVHISNSAASIRLDNDMFQYIRFGVSMYGMYPSNYIKESNNIVLKPAFSLHTKIIAVKQIKQGETVSYGQTFVAPEDMWLATIPIGYGDGWIRKLSGIEVLVNGKRMKIVGRICMDQCMIALDKPYPIGEEVILIGKQHDEEIKTEEVANYLDTINYEITCQISARVPRIYT